MSEENAGIVDLEIKYRVPVKCHNGCKSFWFIKEGKDINTFDTVFSASDYNISCRCSKLDIGQGWERVGGNQQYIGHKAKYDKEIFVGDFLKIIRSFPEGKTEEVVLIKDIRYIPRIGGSSLESREIIGNYIENPELLTMCK